MSEESGSTGSNSVDVSAQPVPELRAQRHPARLTLAAGGEAHATDATGQRIATRVGGAFSAFSQVSESFGEFLANFSKGAWPRYAEGAFTQRARRGDGRNGDGWSLLGHFWRGLNLPGQRDIILR
jgi:hypothetical protein